ncbi:MAG: GNAT family N-acetyltransferase [Pseudomonadota bacterium]
MAGTGPGITLDFVDTPPEREAYRAMMIDFYRGIRELLTAAGGPDLVPEEAADASLAQMDKLLPPVGRLVVARDGAGRIVGTGALRLVGGDAAEFKRMYVRPEARGAGLGRALFEARIAEARALGCRRLLADTVKGNTPMLTLYGRYGFRQIPRFPENFNPPELEPFLVYLEYRLPQDG